MKYLTKEQMQDIYSEINALDVIVTGFDNQAEHPSIAYCFQNGPMYIAKICNKLKNTDVYDFLLAHEVRHATHGHFNVKLKEITLEKLTSIIENKISKMDDKLKAQMGANDDQLVNNLYNYFFNIAADMEVNSKLIEDYDTFVKQTDEIMLHVEDIETVTERLQDDIKYGIHPSNLKELYGTDEEGKVLSFPTKMDFIFYMEELVKHVNFNSLQPSIVAIKINDGINQKSDGNGQKEISDFKEETSKDDNNEQDTKGKDKTNKESKDKEDSDKDRGYGYKVSEIKLKEYTQYNKLRKYIYNNVIIEGLDESIDMLYNYNRRKFSNDINQTLVPKTKIRYKDTHANIVIVADVSSSMPEDIINNIVKTIFKMKIPNKLFKLVTWNTRFCQEFDIKSKAPHSLKIGGGTNLASSFQYVNKYLNSESKLFVISDLCDELKDWKTEMKKLSIPESNIFVIDIDDTCDAIASKMFQNYYYLFDKK